MEDIKNITSVEYLSLEETDLLFRYKVMLNSLNDNQKEIIEKLKDFEENSIYMKDDFDKPEDERRGVVETDSKTCNSECGMRKKYPISCNIDICEYIKDKQPDWQELLDRAKKYKYTIYNDFFVKCSKFIQGTSFIGKHEFEEKIQLYEQFAEAVIKDNKEKDEEIYGLMGDVNDEANEVVKLQQQLKEKSDEIEQLKTKITNDNADFARKLDLKDMEIIQLKNPKKIILKNKYKIGDKIKINGEIIYGQDFSCFKGRLENIIFEIKSLINNERYQLIADGYGNLTNGKYGNGAIYVNFKYQNKFEKV